MKMNTEIFAPNQKQGWKQETLLIRLMSEKCGGKKSKKNVEGLQRVREFQLNFTPTLPAHAIMDIAVLEQLCFKR